MKRSIKLMVLTVALALTATTSMFAGSIAVGNANNIQTTVVGSCQWTSGFAMTFPNYDPFSGTADTQTTTVSCKCVNKTNATSSYLICVSKAGGNMVNGANNLSYSLTEGGWAALKTSAATAVAVAGTPGIGALAGYTYTVNGSIAPSQDVPTGLYQDSVVAHVEY